MANEEVGSLLFGRGPGEAEEVETPGYEQPELTDYGTLQEVTEAVTITGPEDGASKIDTNNHHSFPVVN